jgi:xylulokinase
MSAAAVCVLGLDCGTQSAKAGVWTVDGETVSRGSSPLEVSSPRPGWAEQDPRQWWSSVREAARKACDGADRSRIAAVGVAWQRESFTLVGEGGEPLRPGILWLDIRAGAESALRAGEGEGLHAETGKPMDVTLTLPRLDWLRAHEPEHFLRHARWVDVGCWLIERLAKRRATCLAGADTAGMIGLASRRWSAAALSLAGLREQDLPELVEPGAVVGRLCDQAARETGLQAGIPVVAAGGDGQVFAAGMQACGHGDEGDALTLTLGTSVVLGIPVREASVSPLYRTLFAARTDGGYLLEAVSQTGTHLFRWFEEAFGCGTPASFRTWEDEALGLPPGAEGLVTVPHWWGARFPETRPDARGVTLGWSASHGRAHFTRSLLEGVAFELRHYLEAIAASLPSGLPARIAVGGGGARSPLWRSIVADVLGRELAIPEEAEPVALGAALLACVGAGLVQGWAEAARRFARPGARVLPDPGRRERYLRLYEEVYRPLRAAGVEMSSRLTRLAGP